ncbi:MAG: EAL domain-containing protein, partial [Acidimicrobiia bacterium]|nr:EAL domain-containing protein [Acidimicrobiia bacterium]
DPANGIARLVHVNQGLAAMVGRSAADLSGRPLLSLLGSDAHPATLASVDARLLAGEQVEVSLVLRHRSGTTVAAHTTHVQIPSVRTDSQFRLILFRDLSRRSSEQLLADQASVVESLARGRDLGALCHQIASHVETMLDSKGRCWIGVTDGRDRLEAVVTAGHDLDLVGGVLRLIMGAGDPTSARCVLVENLPTDLGVPLAEVGIYALWAFPALDGRRDQRGALVVAHQTEDIPTDDEIRFLDHLSQVIAAGIERAALEATMAHRALHDPLTGLPNRALIVDRLQQALARLDREPSSLSVLLVDIDRFKSLNDSWGQEVGDRVLLEVAGRLLASVRLGDTVGRISSDQFLMICIANAGFDASVVARRVIRSMRDPVTLRGGDELRVSVSVGVVAVDDANQSPTAVIGSAESALASAVENGRGRYALFDAGLRKRSVARHELEQALHSAINGGQLVLHYQPVCEVRTGRMIGAEALVRWDRPGHGLLGPADFIDVAEDSGLIVPLGAWVIEEVASNLSTWPKATDGRWPVVTVNLSARQLADESLVPMVTRTLRRHGLPPARMGFEVTESMKIDDFEAAIDTLAALSGLGCRIAIDDFGIGHATLDYLRRFSMADVIKIDRSFVAGLGRSREDTAIVSASMALATSLKLQVVAEGVENAGQLAELHALGCHYAQGYALSAPVPLDVTLGLWQAGVLVDPPGPPPPLSRPDRN